MFDPALFQVILRVELGRMYSPCHLYEDGMIEGHLLFTVEGFQGILDLWRNTEGVKFGQFTFIARHFVLLVEHCLRGQVFGP